MDKDTLGTIYLIHLDTPILQGGTKPNQHYLGWAKVLEDRLAQHQAGNGSHFMAEVVRRGIKWRVVRTWHGVPVKFEAALKARRRHVALCPECGPAYRDHRNQVERDRRARIRERRLTITPTAPNSKQLNLWEGDPQ